MPGGGCPVSGLDIPPAARPMVNDICGSAGVGLARGFEAANHTTRRGCPLRTSKLDSPSSPFPEASPGILHHIVSKAAKSLPSLAAVARIVLDEAKAQRAWGRRCQYALLALGVAAVLAQASAQVSVARPLAYGCAVAALLLQGARWFVQRSAADRHALGNALKRRALLIDALGPSSEHADIRMLRELAGAKAEEAARQFPLPKTYYESSLEPGMARLRGNLQESAFFTHSLARQAARRAFVTFGLLAFATVAGSIAFLLFADRDLGVILANCTIAFVSFLVAADYLGQAMSWSACATTVERIERRIENLPDDDIQAHMAALADYEAATAVAPAIPTAIYKRERDRLDTLWRARRGQ